MPVEYLEHANITVKHIDATVRFINCALPTWSVRGQGHMSWYGKQIRWLHIGSQSAYLALQEGGEDDAPHWTEHQVGVKHLGMVVPSVEAVVARLKAAGYELDHWGGTHRHRRSVYYVGEDNLQFEFIEYLSDIDAERNEYPV